MKLLAVDPSVLRLPFLTCAILFVLPHVRDLFGRQVPLGEQDQRERPDDEEWIRLAERFRLSKWQRLRKWVTALLVRLIKETRS